MSDIEKARAEIVETRAALAETTAALKVKTDVKTRLTVTVKQNQGVIAAVGGGLALLIVLRTWTKAKGNNKRRNKR